MIIDINELRGRETPLFLEANFGDQELKVRNRVSVLEKPVHSELKISLRSGSRIFVVGRLRAEVKLLCSRCLKQFYRSINKGFELEYWPDPQQSTEGEEFELTYPELVIGFYRNEQLDLSAVVSEQIVLEVPMKPICREECQGLCNQCGSDLNERRCSCQVAVVDPRLAALADMKKRFTQ